VVTAASPLTVLDTILERATDLLVKSGLREGLVNGTSSNKQVEHLQDEDTLDLAGTVGAEAGVGDWVDVVESVAVEDEVGLSGSGTRQVLDLPWHARVVAGLLSKSSMQQ